MPDERERRIAANESRFRQINEELTQGLRAVPGDGDALRIVCECGMLDCAETVTVTEELYERVRGDPRRFLVLPGHEIPDVESVVERGPTHLVVEKHEETAPLVEREDPRRGRPGN